MSTRVSNSTSSINPDYDVKVTVTPDGNVQHFIEEPPSELIDGRKTVSATNTAVQLVAISTPCKRVDMRAISSNTDYVVVGGAGVVYTLASRTGFPLSADDSYHIEIDDVSKIYINGLAGEGVTFTYYL